MVRGVGEQRLPFPSGISTESVGFFSGLGTTEVECLEGEMLLHAFCIEVYACAVMNDGGKTRFVGKNVAFCQTEAACASL